MPSNISAFPARALERVGTPDLEDVIEVLRWRAAVDDYLSDIWDVIGDPFLDLDECGAIGQFLTPACAEKVCCFCLTEFPGDRVNTCNHDCFLLDHVRAKWRIPPSFQRWKTEAKQATFPRKWWEFWK